MAFISDPMPHFELRGVNNRTYVPEVFEDAPFLVFMFWCNSCPYVQAYEKRIGAMVRDFEPLGFRFIAVNANDATQNPEDSFEKMQSLAKSQNYRFPYVLDENQQFAKAIGAQTTPDIFVYDKDRKLVYRGAIDDNWKDPHLVRNQYMRRALTELSKLAPQPFERNTQPVGCAIKWK